MFILKAKSTFCMNTICMVTLHFILTLHIHGLSFLRMIHKYIQRDGLYSSNRAAITFFALQCFEKFIV